MSSLGFVWPSPTPSPRTSSTRWGSATNSTLHPSSPPFATDEFEAADDTLARAADTGALSVVITSDRENRKSR